jgi:hypothetical protein
MFFIDNDLQDAQNFQNSLQDKDAKNNQTVNSHTNTDTHSPEDFSLVLDDYNVNKVNESLSDQSSSKTDQVDSNETINENIHADQSQVLYTHSDKSSSIDAQRPEHISSDSDDSHAIDLEDSLNTQSSISDSKDPDKSYLSEIHNSLVLSNHSDDKIFHLHDKKSLDNSPSEAEKEKIIHAKEQVVPQIHDSIRSVQERTPESDSQDQKSKLDDIFHNPERSIPSRSQTIPQLNNRNGRNEISKSITFSIYPSTDRSAIYKKDQEEPSNITSITPVTVNNSFETRGLK